MGAGTLALLGKNICSGDTGEKGREVEQWHSGGLTGPEGAVASHWEMT